jgi:pilus assembly protein CpaC
VRKAGRLVLLSLLGLAIVLGAVPVAARAGVAAQQAAATLSVDVNEAQVIRLPRPAKQVFVADPDIADIQAPEARTILVLGKKTGRTTIIALDEKGEEIGRYDVAVTPDLGEMLSRLAHDYPQLDVSVDSTPTSLLVSGKVETPEEAHGVIELVKAYAADPSKVVDRLSVTSQVQVQLKVYIAEMARQLVDDYGINWQAIFKSGTLGVGLITGRSAIVNGTLTTNGTDDAVSASIGGGGNSLSAVLDALGQEGLTTILAEPTLTAITGQTATFLSGGEIPVVTTSGLGNTNVVYKDFGIRLNFTPTVLAHDRISLAINPEVSELTNVGSVQVGGITIPALTTRRVSTTVELGSGDSFAIGGLLQNSRNNTNSRLPGLGDIPILGKLFQSKNYQNNESELVVIVTPYIVEPTKPNALAVSEHPFQPDTDVERLMTGVSGADPAQPATPLYGRAGFAY